MTLWQRARGFWKTLRRVRRIGGVVAVDSMGDVPSQLGKALYVIGSPTAKWAILQCPCGCGQRIDVNLMASRRPAWRLEVRNGLATLSPSIWVPQTRCGSHFWIKESRIWWV